MSKVEATTPAAPTRASVQAKLTEARAKLAKAQKEADDELSKDWDEYAADILEKMFADFAPLGQYLERVGKQVVDRGFVMSPCGRRRVMYRVFTGKRKFQADAGRRAKNAPIQGVASEVGVTSGVLVMRAMHRYFRAFDVQEKFPQYHRAVHDANYYSHPYATVIPAIHIKQYVATYGVTRWYERVFGFKFTIEPEISLSLGASDDASVEWDWDIAKLPGLIRSSLEAQVKINRLDADKLDDAFAACMEPWINREKREWLQKHYPLLGVHDLDSKIRAAVKAAGFKPQ